MQDLKAIRDELEALFDRALTAKRNQEEAAAAVKAFRESVPEPRKPRIVTDLAEYVRYVEECDRYVARLEAIELADREAKCVWREAEKDVVHKLPALVWFKVGNYGIGVYWTNWGGSRYEVRISPWQDDMPSLDGTYRGD